MCVVVLFLFSGSSRENNEKCVHINNSLESSIENCYRVVGLTKSAWEILLTYTKRSSEQQMCRHTHWAREETSFMLSHIGCWCLNLLFLLLFHFMTYTSRCSLMPMHNLRFSFLSTMEYFISLLFSFSLLFPFNLIRSRRKVTQRKVRKILKAFVVRRQRLSRWIGALLIFCKW